jgi:hypothetical protein
MHNFSNRPYDGALADVWSCGIVLFILLFGRHPFLRPEDLSLPDHRQMLALFTRTASEEFSMLPHEAAAISRECGDLLARMLQTKPHLRRGARAAAEEEGAATGARRRGRGGRGTPALRQRGRAVAGGGARPCPARPRARALGPGAVPAPRLPGPTPLTLALPPFSRRAPVPPLRLTMSAIQARRALCRPRQRRGRGRGRGRPWPGRGARLCALGPPARRAPSESRRPSLLSRRPAPHPSPRLAPPLTPPRCTPGSGRACRRAPA